MKRQWRVGTLSMGLLLVALGIIMLVSQILNTSVIEHIFKWWPVVLILIGIEILIYVFLSKQEEPKVKFDVFSIIIISIIMITSVGFYAVTGLISSGNAIVSIDSMFDNYRNESKYTMNFEVDATGSNLIIDNSMGDVSVTKGEGQKIEVEANITIKNNDEEYAAKVSESLVSIKEEKDIKITSNSKKYSNNGKIGSIRIDYSVKVPDTVKVEVDNKFGDVSLVGLALLGKVHNANGKVTIEALGGDLIVDSFFGDVDVRDIKGETELYLKNGNVVANNCSKNIKIENSFGDIEIDGIEGIATITSTNGKTKGNGIDGNVSVISKFGDVILSNVSGSVDVDGANGSVDISTVGRDVKVKNTFGQTKILNVNKGITLNSSNGDITVETDKVITQDVNIENKFGDIILKLPAEQNGYFDANTKFGSIRNEFGLNVTKDMNNESVKGTVMDDKIKFKLKSDNGGIELEKIK